MEGKKSKSRALLVFGVPCSGKTTFASKFAEKYDLAFYDLVDIQEKYGFNTETILNVLELIARTHKNIIIEGGLDTEAARREVRNVFLREGYDPALIWVQTDVSTIRKRLKLRHKSVEKAKNYYDSVVAEMEAPSEVENPIILSGKHTFDTQNVHVLAGLADVDRR